MARSDNDETILRLSEDCFVADAPRNDTFYRRDVAGLTRVQRIRMPPLTLCAMTRFIEGMWPDQIAFSASGCRR